MGNTQGSHIATSVEERKIARKFEDKFTASEMAALSRIFRDLARRSPKATVDPEHFDEYVCFPGLHGEQVFRAFDTKKTGNLDLDEFVSGLARSARGTKMEKVRFLFEIYDLKGDGYVWKSELQRLINHVPRSALHHGEKSPPRGVRDHRFMSPSSGTTDADDEPKVASASVNGVAPHRLHKAASTLTPPKPEVEDRTPEDQQPRLHFEDTNDDMVEEAFEKCDLNKDGKLSFEQFQLWIDSTPEVLEFVVEVFERAMTAASEKPAMRRNSSSASMSRATSDGNLEILAKLEPPTRTRSKSAISVESTTDMASPTPSLQSPSLEGRHESEESTSSWTHDQPDDEAATRKEGYLQKIGAKMSAITTRYFVLIGNCLYYFVKKGDSRPRGLIFLGGCQIEKVLERGGDSHHLHTSLRHGFRIVHLDAERLGQRQHTLYAHSAKERDEWVDVLISALSSPRWSRKNGAFDVTQYYDIGKELGTGRFAVARRAIDKKTGAVVAVKSIEKRASLYGTPLEHDPHSPKKFGGDDNEEEKKEEPETPPHPKWGTTMAKTERAMFRREIAVMRLARHQSILPLLAVFEDRTHVHLVMPLMQCDLATYLTQRQEKGEPCDETDARTCLPVVIEAVAYLHHLGVAHRDLKPDNILMEDVNDLSRLRLADFSISQILKPDETIHKAAGSIEYMAPEVFLKHLGAGFPADVWALGVIAILVLFYQQPFGGETKSETIGNILDHTVAELDWSKYTPEARDLFLTKMLAHDSADRITAQDAFEHHPWVCKATGHSFGGGLKRAVSEPAWRRDTSI